MWNGKLLAVIAVLAVTGFAVAHEGVQNETVRERMSAMSDIGEQVKIIGLMSRAATEFDPEKVRLALQEIGRLADQTPVLFAPQETDPLSEALPLVWEHFEDFTSKAHSLRDLATDLSAQPLTAADLSAAMASIGASCRSCHSEYRK